MAWVEQTVFVHRSGVRRLLSSESKECSAGRTAARLACSARARMGPPLAVTAGAWPAMGPGWVRAQTLERPGSWPQPREEVGVFGEKPEWVRP